MKISDHIMRGEKELLSSLVAEEVGTLHDTMSRVLDTAPQQSLQVLCTSDVERDSNGSAYH